MTNLKRRGHTYFVRVGVNPKYWHIVGKREIVRSLKTRDRHQAERRKHAAIADIKNWIDTTVNGAVTACPGLADGSDSYSLKDAIADYLDAVKGRIAASTYRSKKKRLEAFCAWAGGIAVQAVTRKLAGRYVTEVLAKSGRSEATNADVISSALAPLFEWLDRRGLYEGRNPFHNQLDAVSGSTRGGNGAKSYRAWTKPELTKFFAALERARKGTTLRKGHHVAYIALYSGMRLDEICSLKVGDVNLTEGFMVVSAGKTENSVRQVPIHGLLYPALEQLIGKRTGGYLIEGLKPGGADKKRSHTLGNRLSELKRRLFPRAGRELAFHGLRSTLITALEEQGVPEPTTQLIVGHARQSLTYGLYSKGPGLEALRTAINKATII